MTVDEAIEYISRRKVTDYMCGIESFKTININDAIDMAISALRAQQDAEKNELLTRDQLMKMDGQPVWIDFIPDASGESLAFWALVSVDDEQDEIYLLNNLGGSSSYEEVWSDIRAVYRRPPKEKENE